MNIISTSDYKNRLIRNNYCNSSRCGNCKYMMVTKTNAVLQCILLAAPVNANKVCDKHAFKIEIGEAQ